MIAFLTAIVTGVFLFAAPAQAMEQATREIGWADLVPELEPIPDPYEGLSNQQIIQLGLITEVRRQLDLGFIAPDHPNAQYSAELTQALLDTGLDVEDMLAKDRVFQEKARAQNAKLVEDLDGEKIRMAGFAIPLRTVDGGVIELLLVPYVGACIHVPAPPANQLVIVTLDKPFRMDEVFTPIWVTGTLSANLNSQEMYIVDGFMQIDTGYTLDAAIALPYVFE